MKLVQQKVLHFQEGNSDKIYEVDLCEVGDNQYVVNFRYGRRGANLTEGSKTTFPVALDKAQVLFNDLVKDKTKKGYQDVSGQTIAGSEMLSKPVDSETFTPEEARKRAILRRLQLGINTPTSKVHKKWKVSRVAWRAGQLAIAEATPLLVQLAQSSDKNTMIQYCAVWALGFCANSENIEAIEYLMTWRKEKTSKEKDIVRRAAAVSLLRIAKGASRQLLLQNLLMELPPAFYDQVTKGNAHTLKRLMTEYKASFDTVQELPIDSEVNLASYLGRKLSADVVRRWVEEFMDEDTGKLHVVERSEVLLTAGSALLQSDLDKIIQYKIPVIYLQKDANRRRHRAARYLEMLYLLNQDFPHVRQALLETLKELSFVPGVFKSLRHIFKAAEQWGDAQVFGLFAYKVEKTQGAFQMHQQVYEDRKWLKATEEVKKEDSIFAYSVPTRHYFMRHIMRQLDELAVKKDPLFVKMATALLLQYNDATDQKAPRTEKRWNYDKKSGRWESTNIYYDGYSEYWLLNCLLYAHSQRYEADGNVFKCKEGYQPGAALPADREEAYPETWDTMPMAFVQLIMEAKATPVVEFALRAFRQHKEYKALSSRFTLNEAKRFLQSNAPMLIEYGLDLARSFYNPQKPNADLVLMMLNNKLQVVRQQASEWINQNLDLFLQDTEFVRNMLTHSSEDIRNWMLGLMPNVVEKLSDDKKQTLIVRILSFLLNAGDKAFLNKVLIDNVLRKYFSEQLRHLSLEVIGDVLAHTSTELKEFAASLLLGHTQPAENVPFSLTQTLVTSGLMQLQEAGKTLLERLSPPTLWLHREAIYQWTLQPSDSLRRLGAHCLERIIQQQSAFAEEVVGRYVRVLLKKEDWEGLHQSVAGLLDSLLKDQLHVIERDLIFRLLNSAHRSAQELAVLLIERYVPAESLTLRSILRFADNEILQVRQLAWRIFEQNIPRIRYEREEAIRLLDCKWDDSRAFAFSFFRQHYSETDWDPATLIAIADSVREDVQAFGRELITRFFKAENGEEYLLKLAQHPRPQLQLFATNYLEQFASNNVANLQKLEFFFVTVLSQVNKARVAKDRVFAFLYKEAMNHYPAAEIATRIFNRISGTAAIEDKATCIQHLRDIQVKYPNLETVLTIAE